MNHTATHKASSYKRVHTDTEDFRKHTHIKRAMGCPWGGANMVVVALIQ